jgi:hypothetical protein
LKYIELHFSVDSGTPVGGTVSSMLERRIQTLENENKALRDEAYQIVEDVEKTEAEEKYLVEDAIKKLGKTYTRTGAILTFLYFFYLYSTSEMFRNVNWNWLLSSYNLHLHWNSLNL